MNNKLLLALCFVPFYINDIFFYYAQSSPYEFFAIDYGSRIVALSGVAFLFRNGLNPEDVGICLPKFQSGERRIYVLVGALWTAAYFAVEHSDYPFRRVGVLFKFPELTGVAKVTDLVLGIPLVAFSEEIVFRGIFLAWARNMKWSRVSSYVGSCLVFGFCHWGRGLGPLILSSLWALIPLWFFRQSGSLLPSILLHWLTDMIAFW